MSEYIAPFFQWLNAHPQLAGLATFVISAAESVAIIGTIVPGSIMMTAIGALAGSGVIPLWQTIGWAILGAIVGDGISYRIGYHYKNRLVYVWPFRRYPYILRSGEIFFHRYGSMSVFIGRFVGPVRALVPLVAGMLGMPPWRFYIANVTSAIGWAPFYMLPGILLGAASMELPADIAMHVILVLIFITLFIMLCLWFVYKILRLIHVQTTQLQNYIWLRLKKSHSLSFLTVLLKSADPKQPHGQLTLATYFIFISIAFSILVICVKTIGEANIGINEALYHLFRGLRTQGADTAMILITLFGQKEVIFPVAMMVVIWLSLCERRRTAAHTLLLTLGTAASIFTLKHLIQAPRPWGVSPLLSRYAMPSGHATIATVFYMGLALLLTRTIPPRHRWPVFLFAMSIIALVSFSRLYLGAHWFTDVLAGWMMGALLLIATIISFRHKLEKPTPPLGLALVVMFTLSVTSSFYYIKQHNKLQIAYMNKDWPTLQVSMHDWWSNQSSLAAYHVSLFGFPSQRINLVWAGQLDVIMQSLLAAHWLQPPERDYISTLHRIADVSSTEYLPLISPQYLDKKPELVLIRTMNGQKGLMVIRLWAANRTLTDHTPIWVGTVGVVPRSYSWLYANNDTAMTVDPLSLLGHHGAMRLWEWKTVTIEVQQKHRVIAWPALFIREKLV